MFDINDKKIIKTECARLVKLLVCNTQKTTRRKVCMYIFVHCPCVGSMQSF